MHTATLPPAVDGRSLRTPFVNPLRKQLNLALATATAALVWAAPHLFAQLAPMDYGDAPPPYPTLLQDNGARHQVILGIPSVHLGATVDTELDGQPDPLALGDDNSTPPPPPPGADDEDGVIFLTPLTPGQTATVQVICSADGRLDAWVDFDANGSWAETLDQIFNSQPLLPGTNILNFAVPTGAHVGFTFARFRVSRQGGQHGSARLKRRTTRQN